MKINVELDCKDEDAIRSLIYYEEDVKLVLFTPLTLVLFTPGERVVFAFFFVF